MNFIEILIYPGILFTLIISMLYYGILRKLAARMQSRIGPPIWQQFYDFFKLLGKENIEPEGAKTGFSFWPLVALASVLLAGLMVPIAGTTPLKFQGDLIVIVYFLVLSAAAVYFGGLASGNPFGIVGAMRGFTQMVAYEFPFILSVIVPIVAMNTVSMIETTEILALKYPLAAMAFLIAVLAKVELPPFHIPNAHQEIVGGYSVEYTGTRLALIELSQIVKTFVLIALGIALFFGGAFSLPVFLAKSLALLFLLTLARVLFARLRIEHTIRFYWLLGFFALIDLMRVTLL